MLAFISPKALVELFAANGVSMQEEAAARWIYERTPYFVKESPAVDKTDADSAEPRKEFEVRVRALPDGLAVDVVATDDSGACGHVRVHVADNQPRVLLSDLDPTMANGRPGYQLQVDLMSEGAFVRNHQARTVAQGPLQLLPTKELLQHKESQALLARQYAYTGGNFLPSRS